MPEWARPARTPDACWLLAPEARGRELDTVEDLPVLLALSPPFAGLVRSDLKAEDGRPEPARLVPFCSDMLLALKLLAKQFHNCLMTVHGMYRLYGTTRRSSMQMVEYAYVWQGFVVTSCWSHKDGHKDTREIGLTEGKERYPTAATKFKSTAMTKVCRNRCNSAQTT